MTRYEKFDLLLTTIAIGAAVYIGSVQNSINKELLGLNYEPSLSIGYVDPTDGSTGLILKNEGKSNLIYYGFNIVKIATTTIPDVITNDQKHFINRQGPSIVDPGHTYELGGQPPGPSFRELFNNELQKGYTVFLIDVFFMTPDQKKYLMVTPVTPSVQDLDGSTHFIFGGSKISQFDWQTE